MEKLITILFIYILVDNFVLQRFFGICPFLGVSRKMETAMGMGMAVVFVITISTLVTWLIHYYVLVPLGIEFLQLVTFIPGRLNKGPISFRARGGSRWTINSMARWPFWTAQLARARPMEAAVK